MAGPLPDEDRHAALRRLGGPLRRLRARRRRFANLCFLVAGVAFGTALYLLRTRAGRMFDHAHLPLFAGLVALMAALFWLGASAEGEVSRLEAEIAEIEDEIVRLLNRRS